MADMNRLTQLITDVSSDDFFFTVNIEPIRKKAWVFAFVRNTVVESSFFDLSDIEKAIERVEERHKKHNGCEMNYEDFLSLLDDESHTKELNLRLFEVANDDAEFRYLLLKAALESDLTQDMMLDIGGHYIDDMPDPEYEYADDWVDFKLEELRNE